MADHVDTLGDGVLLHAEPPGHVVAGRKVGVLRGHNGRHHAGAHHVAQADVADIGVALVEPDPHRRVHRDAQNLGEKLPFGWLSHGLGGKAPGVGVRNADRMRAKAHLAVDQRCHEALLWDVSESLVMS